MSESLEVEREPDWASAIAAACSPLLEQQQAGCRPGKRATGGKVGGAVTPQAAREQSISGGGLLACTSGLKGAEYGFVDFGRVAEDDELEVLQVLAGAGLHPFCGNFPYAVR